MVACRTDRQIRYDSIMIMGFSGGGGQMQPHVTTSTDNTIYITVLYAQIVSAY